MNTSFQKNLLDWFAIQQRHLPWRQTSDPYSIWVSEVMLQQTQVNTVIDYYHRFLAKFPTIDHLANSDLDNLLKVWEGLGYYARARNLQKAARIVVLEMEGRVPRDYQQFRQLPGVGNYIAAAVQSIAFGQPVAAVDGNVKRVLARLFRRAEPTNIPKFNKVFQKLADQLLATDQPGDHNQALMELGATVCRPKSPTCLVCPVQQFCQAKQKSDVSIFPIRQSKKKRPKKRLVCSVIFNHETRDILTVQRQPDGLLGGLWEFPNQQIDLLVDPALACQNFVSDQFSLTLKKNLPIYLTQVKHAYTHFEVTVEIFICHLKLGSINPSIALTNWINSWTGYQWISVDQLHQLAFTGVSNKFIPLLKRYIKSIS